MLTYDLTKRGKTPLYEYLCRCLRQDILSGALTSGEKLPGRRALAEHLGVSVITVDAAYSQLAAEGCVEARPRRGYYVCAQPRSRFWRRAKRRTDGRLLRPLRRGGWICAQTASTRLCSPSVPGPS